MCDRELVASLLRVQDELSAIQDAVSPQRQLAVDAVLVTLDAVLAGLGYDPPEDGGEPGLARAPPIGSVHPQAAHGSPIGRRTTLAGRAS